MVQTMMKTLGKILFFIGLGLASFANKFRLSASNKQWIRDRGDETLRLTYDDLTPESLVFDIGGYRGQWASDIFAKYRCSIYVFEAIPDYAKSIEQRFRKNSFIRIFPFGLGRQTERRSVSVAGDRSSVFKRGKQTVDINIVDIAVFLRENNIRAVTLMKINIEGGEYDLLDRLIEIDFIRNIDNIQIQFHDFVDGARRRMEGIQQVLTKTHVPTYQYDFIFENWKRK